MASRNRGAWVFLMVTLSFSAGTGLKAASIIVQMRENGTQYTFSPAAVTINAGDTVTWTNTVSNPHDSSHNPASGARLWHSPSLSGSANNTYSFTFTNGGVYAYYCSSHYFRGHAEETGLVAVVSLNVPPSVSIVSPTNGTPCFAPANLTLQATASDSDGTVGQVEFFRGTSSVGVVSNNPFGVVLQPLPAGAYAFTAVAMDNQGLKATSSVVNVTVTAPPTVTASALQVLPDGRFQFRISGGSAGQTCVMDACDTLPNWTPIFTNQLPNTDCPLCPFIDCIDSMTNFSRRFFRTRVFP